MHAGDRPALDALLWSFRRAFAAVAVFSGVANVLLLTPTLYMLQVYDRVLVSQSELTLLAVSLIALFLFGVMAFAEWVRGRVLVRTGVQLDQQLGSRVFRGAFEDALRGSDAPPARAFQDLLQVRQFLTGTGVFAVCDAPWVPVYLAVAFLLHPLLGWCAVLFAVLQVLLAWVAHRHAAGASTESARAAGESQAWLQARLRHAETLEAMGMVPGLHRRWLRRQQATAALHVRAVDRGQQAAAASKVLRYSQQSVTLGIGALLVIEGHLSPGAMIASNLLVARALAPIDMMVGNWRSFVATHASFLRLRALLGPQDARAAAPSETMPRPQGRLQLRDVRVTVPGREQPILQADLEIAPGQTVVVLGPSGAGKSTFARCLLGLAPLAGGEVLLDGQPLASIPRQARGPHIGYLPQDIELFDGSIAANIARMGEPDPESVIAAARATGLHDTILRLPRGYDTPIGEAGGMLSGGQRQRLALARALYGDPALVVLDEPNASLDDAGEQSLLQALQALRAQGRTVVLITHRVPWAQLADRVLVLRDGQVAAYGPPAAVIAPAPAGPTPPAHPLPRIA